MRFLDRTITQLNNWNCSVNYEVIGPRCSIGPIRRCIRADWNSRYHLRNVISILNGGKRVTDGRADSASADTNCQATHTDGVATSGLDTSVAYILSYRSHYLRANRIFNLVGGSTQPRRGRDDLRVLPHQRYSVE